MLIDVSTERLLEKNTALAEKGEDGLDKTEAGGSGGAGGGFRRDVHGLRGLAVVLVLGFHCRLDAFAGGFVGVDIFFVLSGFLIAGQNIGLSGGLRKDGKKCLYQMARMVAAEKVRLAEFYSRRLMRLCPLLLVCATSVAGVGCAMLAPADLAALLKSSTAAVLGLSNIHFAASLSFGYFATETRRLPLLHTWSLAAELQFYLLYPLIGTLRLPNLQVFLLGSGLTGSAMLFFGSTAGGSYFLPQTRAWQFLLGALSSQVQVWLSERLGPSGRAAQFKDAARLGSLILIAAATTGLAGGKLGSLAACGASGLVIVLGGADETVGIGLRLLHCKALQLLGDISYSLYVWHWPLLSFLSFVQPGAPPSLLAGLMVPVAALSFLSKTFIEDVFRKRSLSLRRSALLCLLLPGLLFGLWPSTNASSAKQLSNMTPMAPLKPWDRKFMWGCMTPLGFEKPMRVIKVTDACRLGVLSGPVQVLQAGDSHSQNFAGFTDVALRQAGMRGLLASKVGVPYLHGNRRVQAAGAAMLEQRGRQVEAFIEATPSVTHVAFGGRWHYYQRSADNFSASLRDALRFLTNRRIKPVFYLDFPMGQGKPPNCDLMNVPRQTCLLDRKRHERIVHDSKETILSLAKLYNATVVSVEDILCDKEHCRLSLNGRQIYKNTAADNSHLFLNATGLIAEIYLRTHKNPFL